MKKTTTKSSQFAFILTIMILAASLRTPIAGVGSLLSIIRTDLIASGTTLGLLTSIPLFLFAIVSPLAAIAGRKLGIGRAILASLCIVMVGILIRSYSGAAGLFIGTAILSFGIGAVNVLCLTLIKLRSVPQKIGMATSLFGTTIAVTSTTSVAVSVPIAKVIGWRHTLAVWIILVVLAIIVWGIQHRRPENQLSAQDSTQKVSLKRLLSTPLAWQVTFFVGCYALIYFCVAGWFPTILQSRGFSMENAAMSTSMVQLIAIPFTFIVPFLCNRFRAFHITVVTNIVIIFGLLLFILAPNRTVTYAALVVMGIGMGSLFSLNNLTYSLRTRNASEAAALSGMANCVGFLIAAVGPAAMGRLYDATQTWTASLLFMGAVLIINAAASLLSMRERYLFDD